MSGEVAELAPDITDLKIGQHVVVDPLIDCGECYSCKAGVGNLCVSRGFHGFAGWGGGLSEYMCCKRKSVIPYVKSVFPSSWLIKAAYLTSTHWTSRLLLSHLPLVGML